MQVNGLFLKTKLIFEDISKLNCIKDYCMIGGTALSIQIGHRLSEDLNFCIGKKSRHDRLEEKWKFSELLPKYDVSISDMEQLII